jgi:hypothetical protein
VTDVKREPGEIAVTLLVEGMAGTSGPATELRLSWLPSDPLAVELSLTTMPDHPALPRGRWQVLRDFLRYGLEEPTGDGDVRIEPAEDGRHVCLLLTHPGRPAAVTVDRKVLTRFLDQTEDVVPAGEERSEEAVDAFIERLLAGQ